MYSKTFTVNVQKLTREIGELAKEVDRVNSATRLEMSAEFHLKQLQIFLPVWSGKLKKLYVDMTGENPWQ